VLCSILLALLASAGAASCSGGSSGGSSASTRPPATLTACATSQLHPSFGSEQGTPGHYHATLILQNATPSTCTLRGYVGLQMFGSSGQPLPTSVTQDHFFGRPTVVVLHRAGRASTQLTWVEIPVGQACVTPQRLEITPPGNTQVLTLAWPPQHNVVCAAAIDSTPIAAGVPRT
jgi:hypothetical protein